ncbi:MAG: hypothetical protein KDH88_13995 [Chromatiales bacterium]|nr:hypothetical protein [Chromatiales bacterium]
MNAPNGPGIEPTWCSSDKDLIGTAIGPARLWYTIGHGILNEVYYPRIDIPQIRDLGFIVADDQGFWVEVKRLEDRQVQLPSAGIPLPHIVHKHPRFQLELRICPAPERDALLIDLQLTGDDSLRPYLILAPRLGGSGHHNRAWVGRHRGRKVLWAEQGPFGLALCANDAQGEPALGPASAAYAGSNDLWQDFRANGRMTQEYDTAGPGNVALGAQLPRQSLLCLAFATSRQAAATLALSALTRPFDDLLAQQSAAWAQWHEEREARAPVPKLSGPLDGQFRTSAMVLKCHRDKTFVGAMVASLSVPWGNHGEERGGYHLVWPRDLVESATALLALGGEEEARNVLRYLIACQNENGDWYQNQWLGGKPYWTGVQLDETAFPVLLASALAEHDGLTGLNPRPMVRRALRFIVENGPASPQDRWEEDAGLNAFTLAACIAALVAGAQLLSGQDAELALTVADAWNARLEDWTLARNTELAREHGILAYYVREAPADSLSDSEALYRALPIKNRTDGAETPASRQVALDFLQLVRFGLRRADAPFIVDTVKLADALLRTDTPSGPVWHRYTGDGYGEHIDGSPFDGTGVGRGWPLLTGERGHYALANGGDALPYLHAMHAMAGTGGMLPEQVWDQNAIPERQLQPGRPSGSAMPLAWAHGEFVKLAVSHESGQIFDRPKAVWERYHGERPEPGIISWSPAAPIHRLEAGKALLMLYPQAVILRLGFDGWHGIEERESQPVGLGLHGINLGVETLHQAGSLEFSWRWKDTGAWIGTDFRVLIARE